MSLCSLTPHKSSKLSSSLKKCPILLPFFFLWANYAATSCDVAEPTCLYRLAALHQADAHIPAGKHTGTWTQDVSGYGWWYASSKSLSTPLYRCSIGPLVTGSVSLACQDPDTAHVVKLDENQSCTFPTVCKITREFWDGCDEKQIWVAGWRIWDSCCDEYKQRQELEWHSAKADCFLTLNLPLNRPTGVKTSQAAAVWKYLKWISFEYEKFLLRTVPVAALHWCFPWVSAQ